MEGEQLERVSKPSFLNHVFKFDDETKSTLMNNLQYLVIALVPISLLNGLVDSVIPELDDTKNNFELLVEVVGHIFVLFTIVILVNRIATFVSTYSGRAHEEINLTTILMVVVLLSMQNKNKIGDKINLLLKRLKELWEGKKEEPKQEAKQQQQQQQPTIQQAQPTHQASRADYVQTHNVMNAPSNEMGNMNQIANDNINHLGNSGAGNNMYSNNGFNGLVNAMGPMDTQEPMAANAFGNLTNW